MFAPISMKLGSAYASENSKKTIKKMLRKVIRQFLEKNRP